jgi:hypothetical protein
MNSNAKRKEVSHERFADGSALVTYDDGGMLILESDLARESLLREARPANYNEPPPKPATKVRSTRDRA